MASVRYETYHGESHLDALIALIGKDLSEPYSIFTYRYFLHNWPQLCHVDTLVGVVIGKMTVEGTANRGYIAMLAVEAAHRGQSIGTTLVGRLMDSMISQGVSEIVLETEVTNKMALSLYAKFGFVREERLPRYYLNGSDAYRLKLWTQ